MPKFMNDNGKDITQSWQNSQNKTKPQPNNQTERVDRKFFHNNQPTQTAHTMTVTMQQNNVPNKNLFETLCFGLTML